jgi:M6 family metalloprotease-like protein
MKIFIPSLRSYLLGCLLFYCVMASASPHYGTEMLLKQPDGSLVKVKVYGDEYYQRVESIDGYTLIRNDKGWICYATLSTGRKDFVSTGIIYTGKEANAVRHFPASLQKRLQLDKEAVIAKRKEAIGKLERNAPPLKLRKKISNPNLRNASVDYVKGLAVIIDFADEPGAIAKDAIERYFNSPGYNEFTNNGSVRDYYLEVSGGLLDYSNVVVGYYRAKNPKSYYDCNTPYGKTGELLEETYEWLDQQGFDFSSLTTQDGEVRAVNFFYAGYPTQGWTYGLWPHMSYYSYNSNDGVRTGRYQITNMGSALTLSTTCHENGHMVMGWPDLYDYGYDGVSSAGLGMYCLMAYQGASNNPVPPNASLRYSAGWENITDLSSYTGDITLTSNSNNTFKYDNPSNPNEYFIIESRTKTGRSESLPDEGMMIWHVDLGGSNEFQDMTPDKHYMISLEQADGQFQLEHGFSYGDANDFFSADDKDSFNDFTLPDATWWNGTRSNLSISNISTTGQTMTAKIGTSVNMLPAPTNVVVSETGNAFRVTWQDNADSESGFRIERKFNTDAWQVVGSVGENITTFSDNNNINYPGVYTYRVYAYNATAASPYSSEYSIQQLQSPYGGYAISLPGIVEAENFDNGGEGVAYHDVDAANLGSQYRNEGVDIENSSQGGYSVGYIRTDEWIEYTVSVYVSGYYDLSVSVASNAGTGKFHIDFDGVDKTGPITVPNTGGWQTWTLLKTSLYLNAGTQVMRLYADGYDFNIDNFNFNDRPNVFISSPSTNVAYDAPAHIVITTNATDGNGVEKVEFYENNILLGISTSYPFTFDWTNISAGSYLLMAKAFDYAGASTSSEPVSVIVNNRANNIALNKPVQFSSVESGSYPGSNAVDGDEGSRWSSAFTDNQYFIVDLGSVFSISEIKIKWEAAYGKDFQIQFSSNNIDWTTVEDVWGNTSLTNDFQNVIGTARYVKMYGIHRATPYGFSMYEFEVYGAPAVANMNIAYNKPFVTSSDESTNFIGGKAVDADGNTRWSSTFSEPQYIIIDLLATYQVNHVKIAWEAAYAKNFQVQVSNDNNNWTTIKDVWNNTSLQQDFTDISTTARYIKVYCINRATQYGFSIYELEVYGTPLSAPTIITDERNVNENFTIYPNPAKDHISIDVPGEIAGEVSASVINAMLQTVTSKSWDADTEKAIQLELGDLSDGIYFITVKTNKGIISRKVLIERQ